MLLIPFVSMSPLAVPKLLNYKELLPIEKAETNFQLDVINNPFNFNTQIRKLSADSQQPLMNHVKYRDGQLIRQYRQAVNDFDVENKYTSITSKYTVSSTQNIFEIHNSSQNTADETALREPRGSLVQNKLIKSDLHSDHGNMNDNKPNSTNNSEMNYTNLSEKNNSINLTNSFDNSDVKYYYSLNDNRFMHNRSQIIETITPRIETNTIITSNYINNNNTKISSKNTNSYNNKNSTKNLYADINDDKNRSSISKHGYIIFAVIIAVSFVVVFLILLLGVVRCLRATYRATRALALPIPLLPEDRTPLNAEPEHPVPMLSVQSPGCAGMERLGVPARTSGHDERNSVARRMRVDNLHSRDILVRNVNGGGNGVNVGDTTTILSERQVVRNNLNNNLNISNNSNLSNNINSTHHHFHQIPQQQQQQHHQQQQQQQKQQQQQTQLQLQKHNKLISKNDNSNNCSTSINHQHDHHLFNATSTSTLLTSIPAKATRCPHHVPLPDSEWGQDRDIQIRAPYQQTEITRTYIKPPPNKTALDIPETQYNLFPTGVSTCNLNGLSHHYHHHHHHHARVATTSKSKPNAFAKFFLRISSPKTPESPSRNCTINSGYSSGGVPTNGYGASTSPSNFSVLVATNGGCANNLNISSSSLASSMISNCDGLSGVSNENNESTPSVVSAASTVTLGSPSPTTTVTVVSANSGATPSLASSNKSTIIGPSDIDERPDGPQI